MNKQSPRQPVKRFKRWRTYTWAALPGEVVPVEAPLPAAAVKALGLVPVGCTADGKATAYMKLLGSRKPNSAQVQDIEPIVQRVAADNSHIAVTADPFDGLRPIVAKECDVDNRRAGRAEYYAEKYPAFVRMSEREHEIRQRAAVRTAAGESV